MNEESPRIGPGDRGPCPKCGKDMAKEGGRYWHMQKKHGIWEDYTPPIIRLAVKPEA